ncbi:hypothetical protein [Phyllobacterium bourgognense]|uniref:Uncharacterized protein n=1 Tax=Phyllobacterium bourgognense TaxID=314236 RepID=A0A368YDU4_9HYPH|nr:hypothetical protein [Phyllobacterium bourgognense]RCW77849.1 hypothetical protein C7476_1353 [Phyllobacterium bourgognense]
MIARNPLYAFSAGVGMQTVSLPVSLSFGAATVFAVRIVIFRERGAFPRKTLGTPATGWPSF